MPDLTIEIMEQCSDLGGKAFEIGGYKQQYSPYDPNGWSCSCKGFKYHFVV